MIETRLGLEGFCIIMPQPLWTNFVGDGPLSFLATVVKLAREGFPHTIAEEAKGREGGGGRHTPTVLHAFTPGQAEDSCRVKRSLSLLVRAKYHLVRFARKTR